MNAELTTHLSEEALDDVLIGLGSAESELHLETCAACRGKLEEFHANLQTFNQASLAWSEARSTSRFDVFSRGKAQRRIVQSLEWALAAALLLAIGIPVWNRYNRPVSDHDTGIATPLQDSETQIAQDNDLLRSIDAALTSNEVSPLSDYGISESPTYQATDKLNPRRKTRPALRNR